MSAGPCRRYFIPRHTIVRPKADEIMKINRRIVQRPEARISAAAADFNLGQSSFNSLLIMD